MPTAGDLTGVVMTGPLATRSPSEASPRGEIERVFRGVEVRSTADVSPLLARDGSLDPAVARQLAQPTTMGDLGRRSSGGAAPDRQTVSRSLSAGDGSPFRSASPSRVVQPNLYRPTLYGAPATGSVPPASSTGSRQLIAPRTSSGRSSVARPVVVPPTVSSIYGRPQSSSGGSRSTAGVPSSGTSTSVRSSSGRTSAPRSSAGSSRSSGASPRSSAGSSRPSGGSSGKPSGGSSGTKKQ
jgi:hypothetical protein